MKRIPTSRHYEAALDRGPGNASSNTAEDAEHDQCCGNSQAANDDVEDAENLDVLFHEKLTRRGHCSVVCLCYNAARCSYPSVERDHHMSNFPRMLTQLRSERDRIQQELRQVEAPKTSVQAGAEDEPSRSAPRCGLLRTRRAPARTRRCSTWVLDKRQGRLWETQDRLRRHN